jgi:hypothetical protein
MASSGMLRRVALVRTDISEEHKASFISVKRIGELGTTLAVTSNRRTQRASITRATRRNIPEDAFFIVTTVKTSILFIYICFSFLLKAEQTLGPIAAGRIK